jgi:hypothetical protein
MCYTRMLYNVNTRSNTFISPNGWGFFFGLVLGMFVYRLPRCFGGAPESLAANNYFSWLAHTTLLTDRKGLTGCCFRLTFS